MEKAAPGSAVMEIYAVKGEEPALTQVKATVGPYLLNSLVAMNFSTRTMGSGQFKHVVAALVDMGAKVNTGDMREVESMLTSQAAALNLMFGDLATRAAQNIGKPEYFEAFQRYFNLALKAQNQSRMTLETLCAIKNPPVVFAKQANIANGPQQVNNNLVARAKAENQPTKLLEQTDEIRMDTGTPCQAGKGHSAMATVDAVNGAKV